MRGTTIRLKAQELFSRAKAARSREGVLKAMKELVDLLCADKRTKVTPEIRAAVIRAGITSSVATMEERFGLSAPTIRKILKAGSDGFLAPRA